MIFALLMTISFSLFLGLIGHVAVTDLFQQD